MVCDVVYTGLFDKGEKLFFMLNLHVMQESKPRGPISGNWDVKKLYHLNFDKS